MTKSGLDKSGLDKTGVDETGVDETGINLNITHIGDPPTVTNLTLTPLDNIAVLTRSTIEQPNCASFYTFELDSENSTFPVTQLDNR